MNTIMSGVKPTKITVLGEDPYGKIITDFFSRAFPNAFKPNASQLLDILTYILVGDKNMRLGPVPSPEHLVAIRTTIARALKENTPIPILIAWGGIKAGVSGMADMAEVSAIHQIIRLADSVKMYHKPGISVNIRIEDTGAYWLYRIQGEVTGRNITNYSAQMEELTEILAKEYDIRAVKESEIMDKAEYFKRSEDASNWLSRAIKARINEEDEQTVNWLLGMVDWKGDLPMEQVEYYISRYKKLYPNSDTEDYIKMAADYLGGAKARYSMDGRFEPQIFPDREHISISFMPPIPGAPSSLFNKTLYYRTVPENQCRTHIAPWRAKGFFEIGGDNNVKIKLASWGDNEIISKLNPLKLSFENDKISTCIEADYLVRDTPVVMSGFVA